MCSPQRHLAKTIPGQIISKIAADSLSNSNIHSWQVFKTYRFDQKELQCYLLCDCPGEEYIWNRNCISSPPGYQGLQGAVARKGSIRSQGDEDNSQQLLLFLTRNLGPAQYDLMITLHSFYRFHIFIKLFFVILNFKLLNILVLSMGFLWKKLAEILKMAWD